MESQRSAEMTNDLGVSEGLIYCSESLGGKQSVFRLHDWISVSGVKNNALKV